MGLIINGVDITQGKQGKSAYDIAVENGYSGTPQDFGNELLKAVESQMLFGRFDTNITWNDDETVYTETWTYDGDNYKNVCTIVDDTHCTRKLYKNNVLQGTWNSVETSNGITTSYVAP